MAVADDSSNGPPAHRAARNARRLRARDDRGFAVVPLSLGICLAMITLTLALLGAFVDVVGRV